MHVIAALDKPQLVIYGPTSQIYTPPLNKKACKFSLNLACAPCQRKICPKKHWSCMLDLKPGEAIKMLSGELHRHQFFDV